MAAGDVENLRSEVLTENPDVRENYIVPIRSTPVDELLQGSGRLDPKSKRPFSRLTEKRPVD